MTANEMKHNRSFFALLSLLVGLSMTGFTQQPQQVSIRLKNNSLLPREFKFLERHPASKIPNVFTTFLRPGQSYTVSLKVGTSLALVNQSEINATMRGQDVPGKPLLVVKADDNAKTFNLN